MLLALKFPFLCLLVLSQDPEFSLPIFTAADRAHRPHLLIFVSKTTYLSSLCPITRFICRFFNCLALLAISLDFSFTIRSDLRLG